MDSATLDARAAAIAGARTLTESAPPPAAVRATPGSLRHAASLCWLARLLYAAVALTAALPIFATPLSYDVAWALFFSRRLLEGARPYVDIVDYAPPLLFVLGMPIEQVALATGWPESRVVAVAVIGLTALSLWLIGRVLRADRAHSPLLVATVLIVSLLTMLVMPARDLGVGEHVLLITLLPYAVWCAMRAAGETPIDASHSRGFRIGIGLLASVGLAIAPPFIIAYALLLIYLAWSRRRLSVCFAAEHLAIAISLVAYVVAIVLVVPEYVRRVVPMAYVHHWIHGEPLTVLLDDWMVVAVSGSSLVLMLLAPWLTKQREWARLVRACAWLSVALFIVFLAERRSVGAHFLPARAFNFLAACVAVVGFARSLALSSEGTVAATRARLELAARTGLLTVIVLPSFFVASLVAAVPVVDIENARNGVRSPFAEALLDIVAQRAAGKPIFVMSSGVAPAFPLVNLTGAAWPYRFKNLAFVSIYYENIEDPTIAAYRSPGAQSAEERAFFDEIIDELTRTPPALLIVDRAHFKLGFGLTHFDFVDYYKQSPAFDALLRHYRPIVRRRTFQVFEYQSPAFDDQASTDPREP